MHTNQSLEVMKKAGRKPLPESKKRSKLLNIRVSKAELKQFEALAKKHDTNVAQGIRIAVAQASA
jgi:hypothetical protein